MKNSEYIHHPVRYRSQEWVSNARCQWNTLTWCWLILVFGTFLPNPSQPLQSHVEIKLTQHTCFWILGLTTVSAVPEYRYTFWLSRLERESMSPLDSKDLVRSTNFKKLIGLHEIWTDYFYTLQRMLTLSTLSKKGVLMHWDKAVVSESCAQ